MGKNCIEQSPVFLGINIILENEKDHRATHNSLYKLSTELVKSKLIEFDRSTLQYKAVGKLRELLEQPNKADQQPSKSSNILEGSTTR